MNFYVRTAENTLGRYVCARGKGINKVIQYLLFLIFSLPKSKHIHSNFPALLLSCSKNPRSNSKSTGLKGKVTEKILHINDIF